MNQETILTIAIPTYNRKDSLIGTLNALLPQMVSDCNLLIIDNCSDIPVESYVLEMFESYPELKFKIFRNKVNIGGDSNIIRCFEFCETEWLWTLGDDDVIKEDAIKTIFRDIKLYPDVLYINYNSPSIERPVRTKKVFSKNVHEFIDNIDSIGSMIYMTCNIYNNPKLRDSMYSACYNTYSSSSQWIIVLYTLLRNDHLTILSNDTLCEKEIEAPVYSIVTLNVPRGFSTFLDIELTPQDRRTLVKKLREDSSRWFSLEGVLKALLIRYFIKNVDFDISFIFKRYYDLLYKHFNLVVKLKFAFFYALLKISPTLTFRLVKYLYLKKTGREIY